MDRPAPPTRRQTLAAAVAIVAGFFLWHGPSLLSEAGLVRGFHSDAAIIALMGKKMLEGRGFDFFFWGQNYVGPLSSMFIALAGVFRGTVDPWAMRVGVMAEAALAIVLMWWVVARVDRRAAALMAVLLVLTPPVILRMMIVPLGAEMALLTSAVVAAIVVGHLTGTGWLSRARGQLVFGVVAGISWWMNQQILFALVAAGVVLALQSNLAATVWGQLRLGDRALLRGERLGWGRLPGAVAALVMLLTATGTFLLIAFFVCDVAGLPALPFVLGPIPDALILLLVPHLMLPLVLGEWRQWRLPRGEEELHEVKALVRFAAGAAIGYAPVWLGQIFGWYERFFTIGLSPRDPSEMLGGARELGTGAVPHLLGAEHRFAGPLWIVAFALLAIAARIHRRHDRVRLFFAIAFATNVAVFLVARESKPHYFLGTVALVFALAALGACALWDRRTAVARVLAVAAVSVGLVSIGLTAHQWHRDLLAEPDPLPLLARVEAAGCAVVYADFWDAYRYRLLDAERRAWIPYRSLNRTRRESVAAQKLPGQRCHLTKDGQVLTIDRDLPLTFPQQRPVREPARPRPARSPGG